MAATRQLNAVTIRGSTEICTEFFGYAVNSILYQRGVYPPESFRQVQQYGLSMTVTTDQGLQEYLGNVLTQLSSWLMDGTVQKLVLVITSAVSGAVIERWSFDIQADTPTEGAAGATGAAAKVSKSEKEIMKEIQTVIRQITSSVTFLPLLEEQCTFDMLVYTDNDVSVPQAWEESDPKYITGEKESVRLRSFSTSVHKVGSLVAYRKTE